MSLSISTPESLLQPIVLLVDKNNPAAHVDAVHAAALASVFAYWGDLSSGGDESIWNAWLGDFYAKSVRRASPRAFADIADSEAAPWVAVAGSARAFALGPMTRGDMPHPVSRLQVSGTNLPNRFSHEAMPKTPDDAVIVLNASLSMSTGKAAAQAAHALTLWFSTLPEEHRLEWIARGHPSAVCLFEEEVFTELAMGCPPALRIIDHGRTEIAPGSATAFVLHPGFD